MIDPSQYHQVLHYVLVAELGFSSALVGLIWLVQIVHYPLFSAVGDDAFVTYEAQHCRRISFVVLPLMVGELVLAVAHFMLSGGSWQATVGLSLLAIIWLSTFLIQVPLHRTLASGYHAAAHRALVRSNWVRTVAWSMRALLVASMVLTDR